MTEPDWLDEARERAPAVEMRREGEFVVASHVGGDPVPAGARATMHHHRGEYGGDVELSTAFGDGEELWYWHEGSDVLVSRGEPGGASPDPLADESVIRLRLFDGVFAKEAVHEMSRRGS